MRAIQLYRSSKDAYSIDEWIENLEADPDVHGAMMFHNMFYSMMLCVTSTPTPYTREEIEVT